MSPPFDRGGNSGSRPPYNKGGGYGGGEAPSFTPLFDPKKPEQELYDTLAEQQAEQLEINSSQLRKFFGEVKELYRQFDTSTATASDAEKDRIYQEKIEARFKMLRSKVAYAKRPSIRLNRAFAAFLEHGISAVKNRTDFVRFVHHFEAVVGFMYGNERVKQ